MKFLSKTVFLSICFLTLLSVSYGFTFDKKKPVKTKYDKLWLSVDSLRDKGLPESALKIVEEIYGMATSEKNADQMLKSSFVIVSIKNDLPDFNEIEAIKFLEKEQTKQKFPNTAILSSLLGDLYWKYYENNRWSFYSRTKTINFVPEDIKTWSLEDIISKSITCYLASLERADSLKKTSNQIYQEIITHGNVSEKLRPTLFDFLGHRAVIFFSNSEASINRPADQFVIKDESYFADAEKFVQLKIETKDTLSLSFYAVKIYQDLIKFHANDNAKDALIDADLQRLNFVKRNSVLPNKDQLFLNQLLALDKKFAESSYSYEISYTIASYYYEKTSQYGIPEGKDKDNFKTALELCQKALAKNPKSDRANALKSMISTVLKKTLYFSIESEIAGNKKFALKVDYRNLDSIYVKIVETTEKLMQEINNHFNEDNYTKIISKSKKIADYQFVFHADKDYNNHSSEIVLNGLPTGNYVIFISSNPKFAPKKDITCFEQLQVSNLTYALRNLEDLNKEIHVLDRNSGLPVENAEIRIVSWKDKRKTVDATYHTNAEGYAKFKLKTDDYSNDIEIEKDKDIISTQVYRKYNGYHEKPHPIDYIFTDRAIYRPGQTVYYKVISLRKSEEGTIVLSNDSRKIRFIDVNGEQIAEQTNVTNEYGSYSGTFTIPTGLLNGHMQLTTDYGTHSISVEEYVRPKFEVKFDAFTKSYRLNDSVKFSGKAVTFSDAPVTDAKVAYRIVRKAKWTGWYGWGGDYRETEIANGKVSTDDKGNFEISFKAVPDETIAKSDKLAFEYFIVADVTDITGETQKNTSTLTIGYTDLSLKLNLTDNISRNASEIWNKVGISTLNNNNQFISAKGEIKISKLQAPTQVMRKRLWAVPEKPIYTQAQWADIFPGNVYEYEGEMVNWKVEKTVLTTTFNTAENKDFAVKDIKTWVLGGYKVEVISKDAFENSVSDTFYFTLYDENQKELPYLQTDYFKVLTDNVEPGDTALILVGTSYDGVKAKYEIEQDKKIITSEWLTLNKEQRLLKIPILEKYRGNLAVHINFVRDNRTYSFNQIITVPFTNKDLKITYETYRNKLTSGEKEEWKLKISGYKQDKVAAELMATLYDASLDGFAANSWNMDLYGGNYAEANWEFRYLSTQNSQIITSLEGNYMVPLERSYDALNDFGVLSTWRNAQIMSSMPLKRKVLRSKGWAQVSKIASGDMAYSMNAASVQSDEVVTGYGVKKSGKEYQVASSPVMDSVVYTNGAVKLDLKNVKARTNLNETAFFYPQLQTNENGEVIVKFTMPEALTRWKFLGLAHTKDLCVGTTSNSVITQKILMVNPTPPRFFREGDVLDFPLKITNLDEKEAIGKAQIEFMDAATMKPIKGILQELAVKDFKTASKQNTLLSWKIKIPEGISAINFKVVAATGVFSDGEERIVPVIPNRMLVTETLPLQINGKQTKEFELTKLVKSKASTTLRQHKLTLEFTSNPVWYAVQALPYLMEYPYECSEQVFNRYYANTLAAFIAGSNPKIQKVFETWKITDANALLSNLEKNQELKAILLQETPWVLNATNEREQKKRIALLFDINKMASETSGALNKLLKKQRSNGGFSWFDGMDENLYVTQYIVAGFGHLKELKVMDPAKDSKIQGSLLMAISYIDNQMSRNYTQLKKDMKDLENYKPSSMDAYYLYARSFFNEIVVEQPCKEAYNFYKKQAVKYWTSQAKISQGYLALAFKRMGDKYTPYSIVNSLKENSTTSEELGMYWKENQSGFYWYQAPIEFQSIMIEVFSEIPNDSIAVDNMKTWLLKQKQTNSWTTTKATADAVYALLLRGEDWLANDELVKVKVGNIEVNTDKDDALKVEAGTGYFKTSWGASEIKPEMGKVKVTKVTNGVAWGSLYWQYFEQLDKITPNETPLKLQKKLFIERLTNSGPVLDPVTDKTAIKIGDKIIVRIELRVDRDMEFVHMKDMRASGFEPINVISRYKYQDGLGYYESTKDAATNFFISYLPKGTFVFEYPLRATLAGNFSNGITSIQCMYAPEFASHSEGIRVKIEK